MQPITSFTANAALPTDNFEDSLVEATEELKQLYAKVFVHWIAAIYGTCNLELFPRELSAFTFKLAQENPAIACKMIELAQQMYNDRYLGKYNSVKCNNDSDKEGCFTLSCLFWLINGAAQHLPIEMLEIVKANLPAFLEDGETSDLFNSYAMSFGKGIINLKKTSISVDTLRCLIDDVWQTIFLNVIWQNTDSYYGSDLTRKFILDIDFYPIKIREIESTMNQLIVNQNDRDAIQLFKTIKHILVTIDQV